MVLSEIEDTYSFTKLVNENSTFESCVENLVFEAAASIRRRKSLSGINTHLLKECHEISSSEFDKQIFRKPYEIMWSHFKYVFRNVDFGECPFSDDGIKHIFFVIRIWEQFFAKESSSIINSNENIPIHIMKAVILLEEREKHLSLVEEFLSERYLKFKI